MKGLHTQGLVVLFDTAPSGEALLAALGPFGGAPLPPSKAPWMGDAPGLRLPLRGGGVVTVHAYPKPWPDHMGDAEREPELLAAWSMGFLGPLSYPGGLARAGQHAYGWEGAEQAARAHGGFVRVLVTYAVGAKADAPLRPPDYAALPELSALTHLVAGLAGLPGALAFFNPGGEVLHPPGEVATRLDDAQSGNRPPLDLWSNIRMFRLDEGAPWMLMDSVGLGQLDLPDLELAYPTGTRNPGEVAAFIRNLSLYLVRAGDVLKEGDTVGGPGGKWVARRVKEAHVEPPRAAVRLYPAEAGPPPASLR